MTVTVITGAQWGDEGKGKITDYYAEDVDFIVRFQGGNNAGHTVVIGTEKYKLHLIPSGILWPEKFVAIGNGCVIDPEVLFQEIDGLEKRGNKCTNLLISDRAHIIFPYHKLQDEGEERMKGALSAGTTKRGIGPCYADKAARFGIRVIDLLDEKALSEKLDVIVPFKQKVLADMGITTKLDADGIKKSYLAYGKRMEPHVVDLSRVLYDAMQDGRNILLEGAQGTHLDIDHGIYPYTTSSNTIAGGACTGAGVGPTMIDNVLGVVKAYTTRVGTGPMPTELSDELGKRLQTKGGEFGTTTGRTRRCGWLDMMLVRYAVRVNGYTGLAITKLDVLGGLEKIKVCTKYEYKGKVLKDFPASMKVLEECKPVYVDLDGWEDLPKEGWQKIAKKGYYRALPKTMRDYIKFISKDAGVPIHIVSVGEDRNATLDRREVASSSRGVREEEHD